MGGNELKSDSFVIFIMYGINIVLNYIFQLSMGRMLGVQSYGTLNALLSLLVILSIPTSTVLMLTVKYVAKYNSVNDNFNMKKFLNKHMLNVVLCSILLCIVGISISTIITRYLKLTSNIYVIIIIFIAVIMLVSSIPLGVFQGLRKFTQLGWLSILGTLVKLVLSITVIVIGYSIRSVLSSILIANLVVFVIGLYIIRGRFHISKYEKEQLVEFNAYSSHSYEIFKELFPILIMNLCIAVFTNIDIIMVNHYFPNKISSLYSCASLFGNMLIYLSAAVVTAMFPTIVHAKGTNISTIKPLKQAITYTIIICGVYVMLIYVLCPIVINLMYGSQFQNAVMYTRIKVLAVVPYCVLAVLSNYNLAINESLYTNIILIIGCIIEVLMLCIFHGSIAVFILIIGLCGFTMMVLNLMIIWSRRAIQRA